MPLDRKVRYGMIGGGPGAFIGAVHRSAAALDGEIELVAGAFSSNEERSREQGASLHLNPSRVYRSWKEMLAQESSKSEDEKLDFVSIVTPNHLHFEIAKEFIEAGFHIICDKPLTNTLEEAEFLCRLVDQHDVTFAVTHNYTGYPMVKQARALIQQGKIGEIRKIVVEYPQGWLANPIDLEGQKQAEWRTDPVRAGVSSAIGDIGSHAENLARYVTGLEIERLCADLTTFVPGRKLEDDANLLVHYAGGAKGILYASQISIGEENNLSLRVFGSSASIMWRQENPNYLWLKYLDRPDVYYKHGNDYLEPITNHNSRLPFGHPEAFIEAFANVYLNVSRTIAARIAGDTPGEFDLDFPTVQDGARGVHFIHTAVKSGREQAWVDARYTPPGG